MGMVSYKTVSGVFVMEDTDEDVCFYCIALFNDAERATALKEALIEDINSVIDTIEDNDEEFFTEDYCSNEDLKQFLINAELKEGIRVRNCTYKIFTNSEVLYT